MWEMTGIRGICQRNLWVLSRTSPTERLWEYDWKGNEVDLPKPVGVHMKLEIVLQEFVFALLGFHIALAQSFFSRIPILLIGNGSVTQVFLFYRGSRLKFLYKYQLSV